MDGPVYEFDPDYVATKTWVDILATGIPHAGGLAMLAAEELETLGGWNRVRSVDPKIWAQLCRHILKNDTLH